MHIFISYYTVNNVFTLKLITTHLLTNRGTLILYSSTPQQEVEE